MKERKVNRSLTWETLSGKEESLGPFRGEEKEEGKEWQDSQRCRGQYVTHAKGPASTVIDLFWALVVRGPTCYPTQLSSDTWGLQGSGWTSCRQRSSSGPVSGKEKAKLRPVGPLG